MQIGIVALEALVVEVGMIPMDIVLGLLALDMAVGQVLVETMELFAFYIVV